MAKVELSEDAFNVFVNSIGMIEGEEGEWFAMQTGVRQGCLPTLFGRRVPNERLIPAIDLLSNAIDMASGIKNIRWLTWAEFAEVSLLSGQKLNNHSCL